MKLKHFCFAKKIEPAHVSDVARVNSNVMVKVKSLDFFSNKKLFFRSVANLLLRFDFIIMFIKVREGE